MFFVPHFAPANSAWYRANRSRRSCDVGEQSPPVLLQRSFDRGTRPSLVPPWAHMLAKVGNRFHVELAALASAGPSAERSAGSGPGWPPDHRRGVSVLIIAYRWRTGPRIQCARKQRGAMMPGRSGLSRSARKPRARSARTNHRRCGGGFSAHREWRASGHAVVEAPTPWLRRRQAPIGDKPS